RHGPRNEGRVGLEGEAGKAAAGERFMAGPYQGGSQRGGVSGERAFHLEGRPAADVTVEADPEWLAAQPDLEPGALAVERGGKIIEAEAQVHRLVPPDELPGCDEALGDRRPSQRH